MAVPKTNTSNRIPTIYQCDSKGRENHTVVADLDGTLLVGRKAAGIRVLIFATFAGVKVSAIKSAASAVLPKHYSEDMHPETWRVFSSCGRKCVLTANPRIMVEPFLKNYLGVDVVLGTEISSFKGIATGFVASSGVLVGRNKAIALRRTFGAESMPDIGVGDRKTDFPFMKLCKERYIVPSRPEVARSQSKAPRLVMPKVLPPEEGWYLSAPIELCSMQFTYPASLGRMTTTISYSVASFTEFLSPIKTSRLTRERTKDAQLINDILDQGRYLVMCPEGTTCREPYLLRFSSLFAELTDQIVPVAIVVKTSMFHGTTARGHKWLDPFFFFMNPFPAYEITFLNKLSPDQTCSSGKSSHEVANSVQEMIAKTLNYKCTNLTRKDKYRALAGTDGLVGQQPVRAASKVIGG
ncbi:Glycerol-3-phosphate acyltransferase RAM2 [Sesamum angolense]|uniref:Glycerol-3-phosphate acyltransferase RAM2 n=1 Tax=Sesamum angolense TaxID=2727404 RepID=A0AAE1W7H8_9LAMI|nr:Glycerol-3-phosphate acyltransferase RAM2 [Sesamum angolense]